MTPEVVSVPTKGIERWLSQRLSGRLGVTPGAHDGVCANIEFPFPGTLVSTALARATGNDPKADPWLPERAVWPLMEVVEEHFEDPWLAPLADHIRNSGVTGDGALPRAPEQAKRFSMVRHVADLFDRYAVHRPDMLQRWAAGRAAPRRSGVAIRALAAAPRPNRPPQPGGAPAECLPQARRGGRSPGPSAPPVIVRPHAAARQLPRCARGRRPTGEPFTYSSSIRPPSSGHAWREASVRRPGVWPAGKTRRRRRLATRCSPRGVATPARCNSSWAGRKRTPTRWRRKSARATSPCCGASRTTSGPIARPRASPTAPPARCSRPRTTASSVHSCHGRGRQVEVLRDAILHRLAEDPDLEPRDIIVMCPDIEHFAPLIQATFGAYDEEGGRADRTRQLRIRLADRSLRQTNPVMGVLAEVLELATARMTVSQVLDLAGREPVRRRFRLGDDDLARLEQWVRESNVRWGFDAVHREAFRLGRIEANTWRSGLDRVLLGVAMAEDGQRLFADTLPLDDVESGDIELAGRLAEFVERLRSAVDRLSGDRTMREWAFELAAIADSLTMVPTGEAWQRAELTVLLDRLVDEATADGEDSAVAIGSDDVRSILAERLKGRATRANFRTGHLTVCTLVPMRSIPHQVVCLLGLDDGSFPRHIERDGDDLTAQDPRVGDRDARSEDRQLLLDALAGRARAPRDHLQRTRRALEPAPPTRSARGRVVRRGGPHRPYPDGPGTRRDRRPAPAAALRPPQLPARPTHPRPSLELRHAPSRRRPRRARARAARSALPGAPVGLRRRHRRRRPAAALPARPREGVPARAAGGLVVGPDP